MNHPRTCLVTGATSGVGEAIATKLATTGARVILGARSRSSGKSAVSRVRAVVPGAQLGVVTGDLSRLDDVRSVARQVTERYPRLDALILNAGVVRPTRELTVDGFETDFATNYLSQFLLTRLLTDKLRASAPARVVSVTSSAQRHLTSVDLEALVTGENFHHMHTYTATKLLNVMFIRELAHRLEGSGVTANAADPGFVRTRLGRDAPGAFGLFLKLIKPFQLSPAKAAATPVHMAISPELDGVTGAYFAKSRSADPGQLAQDEAAATRLWDLSERLIADRH